MKVNVQYFALLREQAGISSESLFTKAKTAGDLYRDLATKYGFTLQDHQISIAINNEFKNNLNTPLKENESIVFIPPVAGG